MKRHFFTVILLALVSLAGIASSGNQLIDSLKSVIENKNNHDTTIIKAYSEIAILLHYSDPELSKSYSIESRSIIEKLLIKNLSNREKEVLYSCLGSSYSILSSIYRDQESFDTAMIYIEKAISIYERLGAKDDIANVLNSKGLIYDYQGDIPKALEYYHKSLKMIEEVGDKKGIASAMSNIAYVYNGQGEVEKALDYYQQSLKFRQEIDDKNGISSSYLGLASVYKNKGDVTTAVDYLHKAYEVSEEVGNKQNMATILNNLATVYRFQGDDIKSLEYFNKSLSIYEEAGYKYGITSSLRNIGGIYLKQKEYNKAEEHLFRSLEMAKESGFIDVMSITALLLSEAYETQGKSAKAFDMYKLHIQMRDSLNNEETQKAIAKQQAKYEYEKQKAVDDAEHEKQLVIEQEAKEKQKLIAYSSIGGLILVILFLVFVFNRLQITKKQKVVIQEAHYQLEEKNNEILDSIAYAKRIQTAILPPDKMVKEYLQNSFILYKPKDIVAGDFYWMETVSSSRHSVIDAESTNKNKIAGKASNDDIILFAAADCTGHGVPGAMVSVICNNGLNRSVREYNLTDPGKILDKTREIVIQEFEKSEDEVKDGMDIALCSLSVSSSGEAYRELQYAGANNPLWIIRNGATEIEEVKATKQPIGKYANPEPYITHTIELQKGDSIYIFTDGYADQFGGERGKKFKGANFKKLLLSIQNENMEKQKELIDNAFENWRGKLEQIDDVCIIGVRV